MTAEVPIVALAATKANHPGGASNVSLAYGRIGFC